MVVMQLNIYNQTKAVSVVGDYAAYRAWTVVDGVFDPIYTLGDLCSS